MPEKFVLKDWAGIRASHSYLLICYIYFKGFIPVRTVVNLLTGL